MNMLGAEVQSTSKYIIWNLSRNSDFDCFKATLKPTSCYPKNALNKSESRKVTFLVEQRKISCLKSNHTSSFKHIPFVFCIIHIIKYIFAQGA